MSRPTQQWRGVIEEYRDLLDIPADVPAITLGEGGTPLVASDWLSGVTGGTVGLKVLDATGTVLATYAPNSCNQSSIKDDGNWVTIDLTAQAGKQAKVQIFDNEAGGCGCVSFDQVYLGAVKKK